VWFARVVKTFLAMVAGVPLLLAAGLLGLFLIWGNRLPLPTTVEELRPSARSVVFDRKGVPIGGYFTENRNPISLAEVPPQLKHAVLAAEDRRFYGHWGINMVAFARAALRNVAAREVTQGASTITMQLARNLFLDQSRTLERKLKEIVLAVRLERSFSKDELLELYLNRIYFGEGAYGVQAAARRFFSKDVGELTVPEAAMIAGLPANPAAFSPVRHPEAALRRRNRVLGSMREIGRISDAAYERMVAEPLGVLPGGSPSGEAPYFLEYVRLQLMERFGGHAVYEGGLRIRTSLELDLQRAAETAVEKQCRAIEASRRYRETFESFRGSGSRDTEGGTPYLQAALVAIEPQTGQILAMVGGRSWQDSRFNRATQARRQPGSSFKPFIYAMALRNGMRPTDTILDEPVSYPMGYLASAGRWAPKNFHNKYEGPVTLRYALAKSINVPAVKLLERVGPRTVVDFAHTCGIEGPLPAYLSLALGTGEVTPLEMADAYAAFDNQGMRVTPISVLRVDDPMGRSLQENRPQTFEVLDEKTSGLLISMMRGVMDNGTGATARSTMDFRSPAAGKTGTTDDYTDAWFIGCVPRCACAVWVGFDEKRSLGSGMTGAKAALPIWVDFMKEFVRLHGEEDFEVPAGMTVVMTCSQTGLLATSGCRAVSTAYVSGTEPHAYCGAHGGTEPPLPEAEPEEDEGW
jgi:penicillin-binding protein 1A